jgi:hypothetical protein
VGSTITPSILRRSSFWRRPSMASRKTHRANSSGFTVVLPTDLSVSHASSNAGTRPGTTARRRAQRLDPGNCLARDGSGRSKYWVKVKNPKAPAVRLRGCGKLAVDAAHSLFHRRYNYKKRRVPPPPWSVEEMAACFIHFTRAYKILLSWKRHLSLKMFPVGYNFLTFRDLQQNIPAREQV